MDRPFEVLGLAPDADEEAIERAYRERVMEAHPDQGGSVEEFQTVRTAYEALISGEWEGGDEEEEEVESVTTRVTYLNYDMMTDHGWGFDDDPFERAAERSLSQADFGWFDVQPGESLLEAAERHGFAWPFACRGGACVNCAIRLIEGELSMPVSTVLPPELMERGFRLSCNGIPITDELKVVYNVKHMPELEELLLPPRPFEQAHLDD